MSVCQAIEDKNKSTASDAVYAQNSSMGNCYHDLFAVQEVYILIPGAFSRCNTITCRLSHNLKRCPALEDKQRMQMVFWKGLIAFGEKSGLTERKGYYFYGHHKGPKSVRSGLRFEHFVEWFWCCKHIIALFFPCLIGKPLKLFLSIELPKNLISVVVAYQSSKRQ